MTATTKTIGKYQILEQIGAGGFGEVFKGYDPFIKRHVAVKTCNSEDPDIRNRFFTEAEIAGNLHHRNITTVYDFGVQDELPYLVQEYLTGEDLDRKIKREEHIPFPEKLHYLLQIARGLAHAHSQKVVHRDIKPANVRVLEDGTVKIMDFGIARLAQSQSGLTQTGMTMGTAAYLAPEQIRGERAELRTDVFAFGTLAYELITLERPFKGDHISALLFQILNHQPNPIHELRPDCPEVLIRIVERCLEKEPLRRYASGGELLAALEVVQTKGRLEREGSGEQRLTPSRTSIPSPLVTASTVPIPPPPPLPPAAMATPTGVPTPMAARTPTGVPTPATAPSPSLDHSLTPTVLIAAPPPPPAPTLALRTTSATPTTNEVGNLELDGTHAKPLRSSTAARPRPALDDGGLGRAAGSSMLPPLAIKAGAVIALALAAIAVGWWLGTRGNSTPRTETLQTVDVQTPANAATVPPSPVPRSTVPPPPAPPPSPITTSTAPPTIESATPETPPAGSTETAPTEEAAPPPPEPATLVVPRVVWTQRMTVRLDRGTALSLGQQRSFGDLEPGSYTLSFRLELDGYVKEATRRVELESGERQQVASPIAQPALLTARAKPAKPQGEVFLDGKSLGSSPLSKRWIDPGQHLIEIRPNAGDTPPITETVTIASGQEAIVSFDLPATADRLNVHVKDAGPLPNP